MFASGVRNNFPQVCFPRVGNWRMARFFMFVRQFNDFCELLSRIFRNARQRNAFLVFWDTFSTVVQNGIVGSVFSPSSRNCFYNGLCFAQLNRRRGVEIWRALAMLWTLTTIIFPWPRSKWPVLYCTLCNGQLHWPGSNSKKSFSLAQK